MNDNFGVTESTPLKSQLAVYRYQADKAGRRDLVEVADTVAQYLDLKAQSNDVRCYSQDDAGEDDCCRSLFENKAYRLPGFKFLVTLPQKIRTYGGSTSRQNRMVFGPAIRV